ncbi:MAG TPA: helicase-associated domain-containing protein [Thermomicrobiales bacterium]|nr:helicase-associated domain-containing protein [Thermomicrobiales bacterium]
MIMTGKNDVRNLLGRLNARSSEDLGEIAATWRAPMTSRDRLTQIATLYRTMLKPVMVREQWDTLPLSERALVNAVIAAGESGITVGELASDFGQAAADVRERLGDLYRAGILSYEGTANTLPVGEAPVVFVPRELAAVITQVDAEITRGDTTQLTLADLFALRSDRELFEAADLLKVDYVPGLVGREEIIRLLSARLTNPTVRMQAIEGLGHDVRTMWERLGSAPPGTPVTVESLVSQGNDRTHAGRLAALNDLEDRLFVWPVVIDGQRAMFVPIQHGTEFEGAVPKPLVTNFPELSWRPEAPLAWDLTVVLQRLLSPIAPPGINPLQLTAAQAQELGPMLWNAPNGAIPPGYMEALLDLGVHLGLLEEPDDGSTSYERTDRIRSWRLGPWEEQADRVRGAWLNSQTWIEGYAATTLEPWQVDWQAYRVKLLHHLSSLEPGRIYRLRDLTAWIGGFDPDIAGVRATVAVVAPAFADGDESNPNGLRALLAHTITTMLNWQGLIDVIAIAADETAVRLDPRIRQIARATPGDRSAAQPEPMMTIEDDLIIIITNPSAIQIWSLLAFAEPVELGQATRFVLTAESMRAAQLAGFRTEQVIQFLTRQAGSAVPDNLAQRIERRAAEMRGLEMTAQITITTDSEADALTIKALLEADGYVVLLAPRSVSVGIGRRMPIVTDVERIESLLKMANLGEVDQRIRL